MNPAERAELLHWLNNKLTLDQLKEVASHVNAAITFKKGALIRSIPPGTKILAAISDSKVYGTVIKSHRTSITLETEDGRLILVGVDAIMHIEAGEGPPLPPSMHSAVPGGPSPTTPVVVDYVGPPPEQDMEPPLDGEVGSKLFDTVVDDEDDF